MNIKVDIASSERYFFNTFPFKHQFYYEITFCGEESNLCARLK